MIINLLSRRLDLVIARGRPTLADASVANRLSVEVLFHDEIVVVAGLHNGWTKRRNVCLADLANEPWISSAPGHLESHGHRGRFSSPGS